MLVCFFYLVIIEEDIIDFETIHTVDNLENSMTMNISTDIT